MAVQMTEVQFAQLLEKITSAGGTITSSPRIGSYSNCTARFNGSRNQAEVEEFINKINIYKTIENISDEDAIQGLPLLLDETAATWRQGVKDEVHKFEDVISILRSAFAPPKPNYMVYMEIFDKKQNDSTTTDDFVCQKRALLSQLPSSRHDEESQVDLVYGLLNLRIREKVLRSTVKTFNELLEKARHVEAMAAEKKTEQKKDLITEVQNKNVKRKSRCGFCSNRGHTYEECRKRLYKDKEVKIEKHPKEIQVTKQNDHKSTITCYGCGKIGFYRSNCPDCKKDKADSPAHVNFHAIHTPVKICRTPPTISVEVAGINGIAYMDTAARTSIASKELLTLLQGQGVSFTETLTNIILADGSKKEQVCLSTIVDIVIGKRTFNIEFLALPYANDNRTLLGIDFLEKASIILNLPQRAWSWSEA